MEQGIGNTEYPVIFKQDTKGKIRTFQMETSGGSYRTITGLIDGKKTITEWTLCTPKNVGKANETSIEFQADAEVKAKYAKKLAQEHYTTTIEHAQENRHKYFAPMLAEKAIDVKFVMKDGMTVILDPKLDGMRMVEQMNASHSRKGLPIAAAGKIHDNLQQFFDDNPTITLDGELYNHAYHDDFQTLMSLFRKEKPTKEELEAMEEVAEYHIYDMFDSDNPNMTALERKQFLDDNQILNSIKKVHIVKWKLITNLTDYQNALDENLADGYEGSIVRIPDSIYVNKRSRSLIKIKIFDDAEFTILDIKSGKGNRAGVAACIDVDVNGHVVGCGIRGTVAYCTTLLENMEDYIGLKATVRYFGFTDVGKLRFPKVIDINRPD